MAYNPRNNGGTAHLFGTTKKLGTLPKLGEPPSAERPGNASAGGGSAAAQPQPMALPPTFAQLQAEGQARPAAPPTNPYAGGGWTPPGQMPMAPQWTPSPGNAAAGRQVQSVQVGQGAAQAPGATTQPQNPLLRMIGETLQRSGTGGGRYDTDLYQRLRDAALGDLDADFTGRRQALNEDMARRGLWSSSGELGAGGRLGDLEGQYARARGGIETDLLRSAAETQWQDRQARDTMMMQLAQMLAGMKPKDMQKFLASLNTQG